MRGGAADGVPRWECSWAPPHPTTAFPYLLLVREKALLSSQSQELSANPALLPAESPRECSSAAETGSGRAAWALRAVPARHLSPAESPAERSDAVSESGFVSPQPAGKGLGHGALLESEKIKAGMRIPEQRNGGMRRRVCCYLRWLRLYRNSFHNELHVSGGSSGRDPPRSAV